MSNENDNEINAADFNGLGFFVGLLITSLATGTMFGSSLGFLCLGIGVMGMSILGYLNGGKK